MEPRERLVLPEPGRSLFERTIGILNRHFPHGRRSAGFILGGGTLLGGRWGPIRRSHDIDVKVSPHPDHRILSGLYANPEGERSLDTAMRAAGAKGKIREHEFTLIYIFDEGQVELAQLDPHLKEPPILSEIQGRLVWTERTEQILAGKITDRVCGEPPVRDLFDCAAAERYDPRALQKAVERTSSGVQLNAALKQAFRRREAYRRLAESEIAEAHEDLAQAKAAPVRCAVNAITSVAVREAEAGREGGRWRARCASEAWGEEVLPATSDTRTVAGWLVERGVVPADEADHEAARLEEAGEGSYWPVGAALDVSGKIHLMVTAQGRVHVQDMSETEGWTGTFNETAKWMLVEGVLGEEDLPQFMKSLEREQERAIDRERGKTR